MLRSSCERILVVDDDAAFREVAQSSLELKGYEVRGCGTGHEAIEIANAWRPDAILLDVDLPDANGFTVYRALRDAEETRDSAVLFVSGRHLDERTAVEALSCGAADYLRRPFGASELLARLEVALRNRRLVCELRRLGSVDPLTGLANRRAFFEALERERRRAQRDQIPLSLVVIDVDHFKVVNDSWGHAAGDAALTGVAQVLTRSCRATDVVARIGGEEFALILPSTTTEGAQGVAEKLRASIAALRVPVPGSHVLSVTASFGLATAHGVLLDTQASAISLLDLADGALYRAKRAGRDRVEAA